MRRLKFVLGFRPFAIKEIFICPSHECNVNCVHSYGRFNHEKFQKSLTTEQVKDSINQFYELGDYFVYFCSGEFLLRDGALNLIRYARYKKNIAVNLQN